MTRYSVQPREYFCLLRKLWGKKIGKFISKILSGKYSQKLLDHAKQSAAGALIAHNYAQINDLRLI